MGIFDNISSILERTANTSGSALRRSSGGSDFFRDALERAEKFAEEEKKRQKLFSLDLNRTSKALAPQREYALNLDRLSAGVNNRPNDENRSVAQDTRNARILEATRGISPDVVAGFGGNEQDRFDWGRRKIEREELGLQGGAGNNFNAIFSGRQQVSQAAHNFLGQDAAEFIQGLFDAPKGRGPKIEGTDIALGDIGAFALDEATAWPNWLLAGVGASIGPAAKGASKLSRLGRNLLEPASGAGSSFPRALSGEVAIGTGARAGAAALQEPIEKLPGPLQLPASLAASLAGGVAGGSAIPRPRGVGSSGPINNPEIERLKAELEKARQVAEEFIKKGDFSDEAMEQITKVRELASQVDQLGKSVDVPSATPQGAGSVRGINSQIETAQKQLDDYRDFLDKSSKSTRTTSDNRGMIEDLKKEITDLGGQDTGFPSRYEIKAERDELLRSIPTEQLEDINHPLIKQLDELDNKLAGYDEAKAMRKALADTDTRGLADIEDAQRDIRNRRDEIEKRITVLNKDINRLELEGKPVKDLVDEWDDLSGERARLDIKLHDSFPGNIQSSSIEDIKATTDLSKLTDDDLIKRIKERHEYISQLEDDTSVLDRLLKEQEFLQKGRKEFVEKWQKWHSPSDMESINRIDINLQRVFAQIEKIRYGKTGAGQSNTGKMQLVGELANLTDEANRRKINIPEEVDNLRRKISSTEADEILKYDADYVADSLYRDFPEELREVIYNIEKSDVDISFSDFLNQVKLSRPQGWGNWMFAVEKYYKATHGPKNIMPPGGPNPNKYSEGAINRFKNALASIFYRNSPMMGITGDAASNTPRPQDVSIARAVTAAVPDYSPNTHKILYHGSNEVIDKFKAETFLTDSADAAKTHAKTSSTLFKGDQRVYVVVVKNEGLLQVPAEETFHAAYVGTYNLKDPKLATNVGTIDEIMGQGSFKGFSQESPSFRRPDAVEPEAAGGEFMRPTPTLDSSIKGRLPSQDTGPLDAAFRDRTLSGARLSETAGPPRTSPDLTFRRSEIDASQTQAAEAAGLDLINDVGPQFAEYNLKVHQVLEEVMYGDGTLRESLKQGDEVIRNVQLDQPTNRPYLYSPQFDPGDPIERARDILATFPDHILDMNANPAAKKSMLDAMFRNLTITEFNANKQVIIDNYVKAAVSTSSTIKYSPPGAPGRYAPLTDSALSRQMANGDPDPIIMDTIYSNDVPVRLDDPDAPPPPPTNRGGDGRADDGRNDHHIYEGDNKFVKGIGELRDNYADMKIWKPKFLGKLLSNLRINPAAAKMADPVYRAFLAFKMQQFKSKQMIGKVLVTGIDSFENKGILNSLIGKTVTGRLGTTFKIDEKGFVVGTKKGWGDVFEEYFQAMIKGDATDVMARYDINDKQARFIERYMQMFNEMNTLMGHYGINKFEFLNQIPRSINDIDDIVLRSKPNHTMERLYETMSDGIEHGVNYGNPRETMKAYLQVGYRQVAEKQFADEILSLGVAPKDLISPSVIKGLQDGSDTIIDLRNQITELENALKADPTNGAIKPIIKAKKAELAKANKARRVFISDYAKEFQHLQAAEGSVLRDKDKISLFGNHPGAIGIGAWKNNFMKEKRFFTYDDIETLEEYVGLNGRIVDRDKVSKLNKMFQTAGTGVRLFASGFDAALPLIHGIPILNSSPRAFAKLMWHHYAGLGDLNRLNKLVAENADIIDEMIVHGKIPIDTEVFEAIERGGAISSLATEAGQGKIFGFQLPARPPKISRVAAGITFKQVAGRFQSAYNSGLLAARIQMWKELRGHYSPADAGRLIRNTTGGLDIDLLGGSGSQKAFEAFWMGFSPRLIRSSFGLVAQAMELNTPAGRKAMMTLISLGSFMAGSVYLTGKYMFGMSDEDLQEAMNPTAGKKFLSIKTPAGYVGFGGPFRAIASLVANVGTAAANGEWGNFYDADYFSNPFLAFYASRGAPGLSFAQAGIEGIFGVNADPYNKVDGPVDALKLMAESFIPFWIAGGLEGNGRALTSLDFTGFRSSPYTESEIREQNINLMFTDKANELDRPVTIDDLNKEERREFFDKYPLERDEENDNVTRYFSDIEESEKSFNTDVAYWESLVEFELKTRSEFREWYNDRRAQKFDEIDQIKRTYTNTPADRKVKEGNEFNDFEGSVVDYLDSRNTQKEDKAVQDWYQLVESATNKDGSIDFDKLDIIRTNFMESLDPNTRSYVVRNTVKRPDYSSNGLVDEYTRAKEITKPYWEAEEELFKELRGLIPFMSQFKTVEQYEKFVQDMAVKAGVDGLSMQALLEKQIPDIKKYEEVVASYKRLLRLSNPDIDQALQDWYDIPAANRLGALLANFGIEGGETFAASEQPTRAELAQLGLQLSKAAPLERRSFSRTRFSFQNE